MPGVYDFSWDLKDSSGGNVSSGIYYLTIRFDEQVFTEKLFLIN
jgi:hypothetical protein